MGRNRGLPRVLLSIIVLYLEGLREGRVAFYAGGSLSSHHLAFHRLGPTLGSRMVTGVAQSHFLALGRSWVDSLALELVRLSLHDPSLHVSAGSIARTEGAVSLIIFVGPRAACFMVPFTLATPGGRVRDTVSVRLFLALAVVLFWASLGDKISGFHLAIYLRHPSPSAV